MSDDGFVHLGNQRQDDGILVSQFVYQSGFVVAPKGALVDMEDGGDVCGGFGTDDKAHGWYSCADCTC